MPDIFQTLRGGEMSRFMSRLDHVDINVQDDSRQNLLHHAIAYGKLDAVGELLNRSINVNHQDDSGCTPLHYAVEHALVDVVTLLLTHGANVDIEDVHGNGPLWTAVFGARGGFTIVKVLLSVGADASHKNKHGRSPRDFAVQINDAELIGLLG